MSILLEGVARKVCFRGCVTHVALACCFCVGHAFTPSFVLLVALSSLVAGLLGGCRRSWAASKPGLRSCLQLRSFACLQLRGVVAAGLIMVVVDGIAELLPHHRAMVEHGSWRSVKSSGLYCGGKRWEVVDSADFERQLRRAQVHVVQVSRDAATNRASVEEFEHALQEILADAGVPEKGLLFCVEALDTTSAALLVAAMAVTAPPVTTTSTRRECRSQVDEEFFYARTRHDFTKHVEMSTNNTLYA